MTIPITFQAAKVELRNKRNLSLSRPYNSYGYCSVAKDRPCPYFCAQCQWGSLWLVALNRTLGYEIFLWQVFYDRVMVTPLRGNKELARGISRRPTFAS